METPRQALTRLKNGPRPVIGCLPLYPPLELMHSMGLAPVVLWSITDVVPRVDDADRHLQNYTCAVCRRLTQLVINEGKELVEGLFCYNACDTLRNLPEILREGRLLSGSTPLPWFRLHVPMTSPSQADASAYLSDEIEALIRSLEAAYGVTFSEERFAESVALYARMRERCLQLERAVSEGRYEFSEFCRISTVANFLEVNEQVALLESTLAEIEGRPVRGGNAVRVIVSGILPPPLPFCEMMERSGFVVAGNDLACLHRSYAYTPETWQDASDYHVKLYRERFPCTTLLHSTDRRVDAVMDLVSKRDARGFLFVSEKFCEYEYLELPYLEKRLKENAVAVLAVEISMEENLGLESFRTRMEAFRELIDASSSPATGGECRDRE